MNQYIEKNNGKYNQHKARFDYFLIEWLTISLYAVIIILFFLSINNFNPSPRGIREMLKLNNPIYEITSAYGHFGRKPSNNGEFSWEKTDKTDLFKL